MVGREKVRGRAGVREAMSITVRALMLASLCSLLCGGLPVSTEDEARDLRHHHRVLRPPTRDRAAKDATGQLMGAGLRGSVDEQQARALSLGGGDVLPGSFQRVNNSTILFLHVFKCAGTSLREVFMTWAKLQGWSGAIVEYCKFPHFNHVDKVCLNERNDLVDYHAQKWHVAGSRVMAGHFFWDFKDYVTPPYLLITTLRNPLELFVSSQQFSHRDQTSTLPESVAFVAGEMRKRLGMRQPQDLAFIRRLMSQRINYDFEDGVPLPDDQLRAMTSTAVQNLREFFVVGVVEQYEGFVEVLKRSLDPASEHSGLWKAAVNVRKNGSPVHSREVLRAIDPALVREFNATTLPLQWQVYNVALELWDSRCRALLPPEDHATLCAVVRNH